MSGWYRQFCLSETRPFPVCYYSRALSFGQKFCISNVAQRELSDMGQILRGKGLVKLKETIERIYRFCIAPFRRLLLPPAVRISCIAQYNAIQWGVRIWVRMILAE